MEPVNNQPKKRSKGIILVVCIVLIVVLALLISFFIFKGNQKFNEYLTQGELYLENGNYHEALEQFNLALDEKPGNEEVLRYLIMSNVGLKDYDSAIKLAQGNREELGIPEYLDNDKALYDQLVFGNAVWNLTNVGLISQNLSGNYIYCFLDDDVIINSVEGRYFEKVFLNPEINPDIHSLGGLNTWAERLYFLDDHLKAYNVVSKTTEDVVIPGITDTSTLSEIIIYDGYLYCLRNEISNEDNEFITKINLETNEVIDLDSSSFFKGSFSEFTIIDDSLYYLRFNEVNGFDLYKLSTNGGDRTSLYTFEVKDGEDPLSIKLTSNNDMVFLDYAVSTESQPYLNTIYSFNTITNVTTPIFEKASENLVLISDNQYLYFTIDDNILYRCNLDGSNEEVVYNYNDSDIDFSSLNDFKLAFINLDYENIYISFMGTEEENSDEMKVVYLLINKEDFLEVRNITNDIVTE